MCCVLIKDHLIETFPLSRNKICLGNKTRIPQMVVSHLPGESHRPHLVVKQIIYRFYLSDLIMIE